MQIAIVALSLFAALAAGQSNSTASSLPSLVSQLPSCAVSCLPAAADAANCAETDVECICGSGKSAFLGSIGTCAFTNCDSSEISNLQTLATKICNEANDNPSSSVLASVSDVITSAVGTATQSAGSSSTSGAAVRAEHGLGLAGAAAIVAAFAV
ncbi:hypothetical protein GGR56DRAFT_646182 [Xylariaceae sp. FL0804]|nr:hypothetical protein GGR56DRAFT_646182 [Xylariaceae sp. FL0804]